MSELADAVATPESATAFSKEMAEAAKAKPRGPGRPKGLMALTKKHDRAAHMLASGLSIADVADAIGVSGRSVRNWIARPDFRDIVEQRAARLPRTQMSKEFREHFGVWTIAQVRNNLMATLYSIAQLDVGDFYDNNGALLPWDEIPMSARLAVQEVSRDGRPTKFYNKLDAIKHTMVFMGLGDETTIGKKKLREPNVTRNFLAGNEDESAPDDREGMNEGIRDIASVEHPELENLGSRSGEKEDAEQA